MKIVTKENVLFFLLTIFTLYILFRFNIKKSPKNNMIVKKKIRDFNNFRPYMLYWHNKIMVNIGQGKVTEQKFSTFKTIFCH